MMLVLVGYCFRRYDDYSHLCSLCLWILLSLLLAIVNVGPYARRAELTNQKLWGKFVLFR